MTVSSRVKGEGDGSGEAGKDRTRSRAGTEPVGGPRCSRDEEEGDVGWTSFFYDLEGERDRGREGRGRLGGAALRVQQGVGP